MPEATLSDAIAAVTPEGGDAAFAAFMDFFLGTSVGLIAGNIPEGRRPGETFSTGPNDRVTLSLVTIPDGRRLVKACADPTTFLQQYPDTKINVLVLGRELLQAVRRMPGVDGVLVCSATQHISIPIDHTMAARALAQRQTEVGP